MKVIDGTFRKKTTILALRGKDLENFRTIPDDKQNDYSIVPIYLVVGDFELIYGGYVLIIQKSDNPFSTWND